MKQQKKKGGFLGPLLEPLVASLAQPLISSVVKVIRGKGVRITERGYMDKNL